MNSANNTSLHLIQERRIMCKKHGDVTPVCVDVQLCRDDGDFKVTHCLLCVSEALVSIGVETPSVVYRNPSHQGHHP